MILPLAALVLFAPEATLCRHTYGEEWDCSRPGSMIQTRFTAREIYHPETLIVLTGGIVVGATRVR